MYRPGFQPVCVYNDLVITDLCAPIQRLSDLSRRRPPLPSCIFHKRADGDPILIAAETAPFFQTFAGLVPCIGGRPHLPVSRGHSLITHHKTDIHPFLIIQQSRVNIRQQLSDLIALHTVSLLNRFICREQSSLPLWQPLDPSPTACAVQTNMHVLSPRDEL